MHPPSAHFIVCCSASQLTLCNMLKPLPKAESSPLSRMSSRRVLGLELASRGPGVDEIPHLYSRSVLEASSCGVPVSRTRRTRRGSVFGGESRTSAVSFLLEARERVCFRGSWLLSCFSLQPQIRLVPGPLPRPRPENYREKVRAFGQNV